MTTTLSDLVGSAIKREQEEISKIDQQKAAREVAFKKVLVERAGQLSGLLPLNTWKELGLHLETLRQCVDSRYINVVHGDMSFEFEGHIYRAKTNLFAGYQMARTGKTLTKATLSIGGHNIKLIRPNDHKDYKKLNLVQLSERLKRFIEAEDESRENEYQRKLKRVWHRLDAESLKPAECEQILATLKQSTWPQADVAKLIARAEYRLPFLREKEEKEAEDHSWLLTMNQEADIYLAEWALYKEACHEWAIKTTAHYWQAFSTYIVFFEASSSGELHSARCILDIADKAGYYTVIDPNGRNITKRRFCHPVAWQREEHMTRPPIDRAVAGYMHLWCEEFVVNLQALDEQQLASIKDTKPMKPQSWAHRVVMHLPFFTDRKLADQLEELLEDDSHTAIQEFRSRYLNWFKE